MDWIQFIIFIGSTIGLFFWNRSESRSDIRHMDIKLESTRDLVREIHLESKDFHARMERSEAEFRARMEKSDAEFKAHILYHHELDRRKG